MAINKILTVLLVALFFNQLIIAIPTTSEANANYLRNHDLCRQKSTYAAMAPSEKDSSLPPSVQLLKLTLFNLQTLSLTYAIKVKSISELLLNDTALKDNSDSVEIEEFKKKILKFIHNYTACSNMGNLFDLVVLYSTASSDYYEKEKKKTLTADGEIILNVLKKYGSQEVDDEFEKNFNIFFKNFDVKINELRKNLDEEKGKVAGKVLLWWEHVKNLQTYDERMEAFGKYVKLYELD